MSFLSAHVIPRGPGGAVRIKGAQERQKTKPAELPALKGILKKTPVLKETREHKPLKGILKNSTSEESSSEGSVKSPLRNGASLSLVEVLGASGEREMMPLVEVDPAVCVVGDPIKPDLTSTSEVTEGRPTRPFDGLVAARKHALFAEKNPEVLVKEGPSKCAIGGCIARAKKIEGFGDTDEHFRSNLSDVEDAGPPTPQKQTVAGEDGGESNLVEEAKSLLEFYLDDKTALRDELLVKQIRRWSGWISLNFMATYGRLRTLTGSHTAVDLLRRAVKASDVLELSDDETKVRRLIPFPHYDETFASRAVVQLHQEMPKSHSQIFDVFKMFGQVYAIYVLPRMLCVPCALPEAPEIVVTNVRKFLSRNPALLEVEWKALAFVEFASHREAETALFVLTRMAFRGSGCGGPGLPVLLPVKPHPQMHLKLHDPQEVGELTRVLGLALQADENRKQTSALPTRQRDPDMAHEDGDKLCLRRSTGKTFKETMARDPAIVDCGLPVLGPRAHRESASAFELRAVQVARQRVAWEPCVACQLQERGLYDPIAHAFTLRYSTDRDSKDSKENRAAVNAKSKAEVDSKATGIDNEMTDDNDEARLIDESETPRTMASGDANQSADRTVDPVKGTTGEADEDEQDVRAEVVVMAMKEGHIGDPGTEVKNETKEDFEESASESPLVNRVIKSCSSSATQSPTSGYGTDECSLMSCDDHSDEATCSPHSDSITNSSTPLKSRTLDCVEE